MYQHQERNVKATHGPVCKNSGIKFRCFENSGTAKSHPARNGQQNNPVPPRPRIPEKAQIALDGPERRHPNLRIENTLTDEHGNNVKLKKGTHVDITVTDDQDR